MAMQVNDSNKTRKALLIAAALCFVLHLAIVPNIALFDGHINVCMIVALYIALSTGGKTGVIAGFVAGLFFDLTTTGPVGLMAFELTIASYFVGLEGRNRFADGFGGAVLLRPSRSSALIAAADTFLVRSSRTYYVVSSCHPAYYCACFNSHCGYCFYNHALW